MLFSLFLTHEIAMFLLLSFFFLSPSSHLPTLSHPYLAILSVFVFHLCLLCRVSSLSCVHPSSFRHPRSLCTWRTHFFILFISPCSYSCPDLYRGSPRCEFINSAISKAPPVQSKYLTYEVSHESKRGGHECTILTVQHASGFLVLF